jgi:hypothetical protein
MNDICIPIPRLQEQQAAEMELRVAGQRILFHFRIEVFPWEAAPEPEDEQPSVLETEQKIRQLKNRIENYDKDWELVQIYSPRPTAKFIQVLFRQRVLN